MIHPNNYYVFTYYCQYTIHIDSISSHIYLMCGWGSLAVRFGRSQQDQLMLSEFTHRQ